MRCLLWLGALLSAVAVAAACNGDGLSLEEALRRMVLQPEDLPEGFVQGDGSFTANEDAAAGSAERQSMLESWGRILGFEVTYEPSGVAQEETPVQGINVSASLYTTEEGAGDSFADAVKIAEETDWAANYAGLRDFKQEEVAAVGLADEIMWLRLSGLQTAGSDSNALVTDDLIFFREGSERGFLRVQVLADSEQTEDRGHYQNVVEGWLRVLIRNVRDVLPQIEDGE